MLALPTAGRCAALNFPHSIVGVELDSDCGLRGRVIEELLKKLAHVKEEIDRIDRRRGRTFVYRKLYGEAEFNYNLGKDGKGIYNLEYTEELLEFANRRLDEAIKQMARRKQDVSQGKM